MENRQKTKENDVVLNVIDEIIKGDQESTVLRRHRITPKTFDKLLNSPEFVTQISNRIGISIIRSKLLIAQYAQAATAKLISLTECEKEETSRKACLDVIELARRQSDSTIERAKVDDIVHSGNTVLTDEEASRLLAALSENKED